MEAICVHDKKGMDLDVSPNHSAMKSRRKTEYLAASWSDGKLGQWKLVQEILLFSMERSGQKRLKEGYRKCTNN